MKVKSGLSTYYTDHWAPDNANIHRVYPDYIDAIRLVEGTAPSGYAKLEPDITLIRSFEKFSLFYHKTKYTATGTNKSAVTDIIAYRILDLDPPEGYTYMAITFGSLTELTRLCYKTGEYDPATAIIELAWGWNGPLGNHEPPPSFTKINRSLGGIFSPLGAELYLYYAKRTISNPRSCEVFLGGGD